MVVHELLSLKRAPDAALLELENDARDALLEKVSAISCFCIFDVRNSIRDNYGEIVKLTHDATFTLS